MTELIFFLSRSIGDHNKKGSHAAQQQQQASSTGKEVTEVRCSPTGQSVAIGCKDGHIYHLSYPSLKKVGICKGHTSHVRNMDFSTDGKYLKTTDAARDLLHWDLSSMQRITNAQVLKSLTWYTSSCVFGWGLQGIYNRSGANNNGINNNGGNSKGDQEVSCVARSADGLILTAAGTHTTNSGLKLFPYPCLADCMPNVYSGHSAPITDMNFVENDKLITAGGNDCCMIVWDVVKE